jgi:hypothetical protein
MRRFVMTTTVASALMLGGCATTGTNTQAVIEQARQAAVAVCGFLPTVDTVAAILAAGNPIYLTASGIANGICEAVKSIPAPDKLAGRRRAAPVVAGVVIHGRFVK